MAHNDSLSIPRRSFMQTIGLGTAGALWSGLRNSHAQERRAPNIILIMADDMGFSDIGCYGGEIDTPNLDGLAAEGLRFTQFYNTARCCPTRASLLTGLYQHQAGIGHMMGDRNLEGYRGDLNNRCRTIAEVLKTAGYGTYMAGKWHVTKHTKPDGPRDNWPCQRGFDRFYGTIHGAGSFYDPNSLMRDNTHISPHADPGYAPETFYYTDAISDNAATFIREHTGDSPFFVYVAYTAAHWPMHALAKDIAKYRGRYNAGYGPVRAARYEKARKLGLIKDQWELSVQAGDWDRVENKDWEARCMEVYAAMVDSMDRGIGRIVAELKRQGKLDNTLIFYLQDNGGCAEGLGRGARGKYRERPEKPPFEPLAAEYLQPDMIPKQTRDGYPVVQGPGIMPGPADTYIAYGRGWANASNTPFREYKHWVHEGGISTPLVVHWPTGVRRKNALVHDPAHLIDIMATCVDVSGAAYPVEHADNPIHPLEGRSLVPAFHGNVIQRDALFWEHEGNRAVRAGKWKLVAKGAHGKWELYDMDQDRTELHDLADEQPERVVDMAAKWNAWAERAHVLPWPWDKGKKKEDGNVGSNATQFVLKPDESLPREKCPKVTGRTVRIAATIEHKGGDGVIVAQGGSSLGYALYVKDGRLEVAMRHKGTLTTVADSAVLPPGRAEIAAVLAKRGAISLSVNGKEVATGDGPGALPSMPLDGLEVGRDEAGLVGRYETENSYAGLVNGVRIELAK